MSKAGKIAMIAAVGPNLELGSGGDLIWHISADLKNFKRLTSGHPVIMGRKTWDSLPKKPLPGRKNIVLTRGDIQIDGAEVASTPEEALRKCEGEATPFVIGGEQIYRLFMPVADELYLTFVDAPADMRVDAWFPEYRNDWHPAEISEWREEESAGLKYRFEIWRK